MCLGNVFSLFWLISHLSKFWRFWPKKPEIFAKKVIFWSTFFWHFLSTFPCEISFLKMYTFIYFTSLVFRLCQKQFSQNLQFCEGGTILKQHPCKMTKMQIRLCCIHMTKYVRVYVISLFTKWVHKSHFFFWYFLENDVTLILLSKCYRLMSNKLLIVSHLARHQRPTREKHKIPIASWENVDNQAPRNANFTH